MSNIIEYKSNGEEIKLSPDIVKKYLVRGDKNVNDQEIVMFMKLCKARGLNPFLNEAYLIKFGNDTQIIQSKESYMRITETHPDFDGVEAGIIVQRNEEIKELVGEFKMPDDLLLGGWAKVYRRNRKIPYYATVSMAEYDKKQSTWKAKPCTMIRKTAVVHAIREAFPSVANGTYDEPTEKEIVQAEIVGTANKETISIDEIDENNTDIEIIETNEAGPEQISIDTVNATEEAPF